MNFSFTSCQGAVICGHTEVSNFEISLLEIGRLQFFVVLSCAFKPANNPSTGDSKLLQLPLFSTGCYVNLSVSLNSNIHRIIPASCLFLWLVIWGVKGMITGVIPIKLVSWMRVQKNRGAGFWTLRILWNNCGYFVITMMQGLPTHSSDYFKNVVELLIFIF